MNDLEYLPTERNELLWNTDLISAISTEIKIEFKNYIVSKTKILKDIFLNKSDKVGYQLQLGFVDQDIVIYDQTEMMDISDFRKLKNILLHNTIEDRLIVPKIILELKYNGINSHGLITYSNYAADIKSIFPECKYFLILRHKKNSSKNKLFRHGKSFDKIMCLSDNSSIPKYKPGQFLLELQSDFELKERFIELINEIKSVLTTKKSNFIK